MPGLSVEVQFQETAINLSISPGPSDPKALFQLNRGLTKRELFSGQEKHFPDADVCTGSSLYNGNWVPYRRRRTPSSNQPSFHLQRTRWRSSKIELRYCMIIIEKCAEGALILLLPRLLVRVRKVSKVLDFS